MKEKIKALALEEARALAQFKKSGSYDDGLRWKLTRMELQKQLGYGAKN